MDEPDFTFEQQVRLGKRLQRIARLLDSEMKKAGVEGMAWSLYTWGGNRAQYVSNSSREDVKVAMQETLDRWDEPKEPPLSGGFN